MSDLRHSASDDARDDTPLADGSLPPADAPDPLDPLDDDPLDPAKRASLPLTEQEKRGVIPWFADNHVAANLLMALLVLTGILASFQSPREVFPDIDPKIIRVTVPYPGATPEEVELGICLRVEEAIRGIDGIKRVRSVASEGSGSIVVELEDFADNDDLLDEITLAIDRLVDFPPAEAEKPVVVNVELEERVLSVVVKGQVPETTLKAMAEQLREELAALPNISVVEVAGARAYEIAIEVSEASLTRHGLTFSDVARAVRQASRDVPGGTLRSDQGDILLRTVGRRYQGKAFETIPVLTRPDGSTLLLSDVAVVRDGFEEVDAQSTFDGEPSLLVNVFRSGEQDAIDIARTVKAYIAAQPLPEGISLTTWFDSSEYLAGRLWLLIKNAAFGLVLVFLCLACFLNFKLAFWTTLGIPISFAGGLMLMYLFGVSVNMISLFALIVVLGIVVDDAIVVGENIYEYRQKGLGPLAAAVRGAREIAMPVILAVLTTMAAFLPLFYTAGFIGKVMWPVSIVVVFVLAISLIEALLILPAHLTSVKFSDNPGPITRVQIAISDLLQRFINGPYARTLAWVLPNRYLTASIAAAVLFITLGVLGGGVLSFSFMPSIDADNVWASVSMPPGAPIEQTDRAVARVEAAAKRVQARIDAESGSSRSIFNHMAVSVGDQPFTAMARGRGPGGGSGMSAGASHLGEVNIELAPSEFRQVGSREVENLWREELGEIPGVESLSLTSSMFSAGDAINIELQHERFDRLMAAVDRLKSELSQYAGVYEIADSFERGKRELTFTLTDAGRASGLTLEDLGRQLRQGFYGEEAQRVQRGRDDIKVMVRYPRNERSSLADLDRMRIRLPDGTQVPLRIVAQVEEGRGFAVINRVDRRRVVSVTADVDESVANANEVNVAITDSIMPQLVTDDPGLTWTMGGEQAELAISSRSLLTNLMIALVLIFAMLAVQFRSYTQPLIIMSVIPFGLVGAVIGHLVMGMELSFLSMFGLVALSGIVVNDSLILIDLVNRERKAGVALDRAVLHAGARRFRPILLTTMTTFLGLVPMLLETSLQARFLIPMAISLAFGVVFATAITLVLVPALYLILEDLHEVLLGAPSTTMLAPGIEEAGEVAAPARPRATPAPESGPGDVVMPTRAGQPEPADPNRA